MKDNTIAVAFEGDGSGNTFVCAAHAVTWSYTSAIGTIIVIKPGEGVARRSLKGPDDDRGGNGNGTQSTVATVVV